MVNIALQPFSMASATLKIAADNFEEAVSAVEFVPTAQSTPFTAINGKTVTITGKAAWVVNISYAQDWSSATSLARYLFDNETESAEVVFVPDDGSDSVEATVTLTPGSIGGAANSLAVGSVSLGVDGKPELIPAA